MKIVSHNKHLLLGDTPMLTPDEAGGTYLVLDNNCVCPQCGGMAKSRKMYAWRGTKKEMYPDELETYGYGGVAETLFTICMDKCAYANIGRRNKLD